MSDPPRAGSGAMFDAIAGRYDLLNRMISLGLDQRWRARLVESLAPAIPPEDGRILDLATGTADVALALARRFSAAEVTGLDPSSAMLAVGQEKLERAGLAGRIALIEGDAQAMAFAADAFHGATMAFGIRNVPDRPAALRELARVVRPGGVVAILELSEPRGGPLAGLARIHVHRVVPWLGSLLSGSREYRYLAASIAAFPPPEDFVAQMGAAGLAEVRAVPLSFGAVHLYVGRVPPVPTQEQA